VHCEPVSLGAQHAEDPAQSRGRCGNRKAGAGCGSPIPTFEATYEQRDRLVAAAEDDQIELFLILGFHFGLRRREIDHALPSWIDLEQRLLRVRNLIRPDPPLSYFRIKNGKERIVPSVSMLSDRTRKRRQSIG
jgi:integrase